MQAYHSAVLIIAMVAGAWLGRQFAAARNRNVIGWSLAGAILPVTVIVLWFLKALPAPESDAEEAEA